MYDMLCAGCGHRTAMMILDEIINKNSIKEKTIMAFDVACCSLLIDFVDYDSIMCPHGRVLDVTKGYKSMRNKNVVISYMGDGAAYSIGIEEIIHSARRNDDSLVIVINNGLYSMTGGQISPTTIVNENGFCIENILKAFNISYFARAALTDIENLNLAKNYIQIALDKYMNKGGFNMVELLSPCPTNYKTTVKDAIDIINDKVSKVYKIGEFIK